MRRILTACVIFSILGFFLIPKFSLTFAQTTTSSNWVDSNIGEAMDQAREGAVNKEGYDYKTMKDEQAHFASSIIPLKGISYNKTSYLPQLLKDSAVGHITSYIAMIYITPPANTYLAIRDFGESLGFIPHTAYAQSLGLGYTGFAALIPVWKVFRNIAYALIAIIMIIIGFMVMFRKHIDQKTVVTVQNALPKIVLTLILITFSYAIVGFLVDLMYLAIFLVAAMFVSTGMLPADIRNVDLVSGVIHILPEMKSYQDLYARGGLFRQFLQIFNTTTFGLEDGNGLSEIGMRMLGLPYDHVVSNFFFSIFGIAGAIAVSLLPLPAFIKILSAGVLTFPTILALLLALAILFLLIRLFVLFISTYIQIILSLIFAPLQILFEALPGSTSFADWLKNLIGNLSVFVIATAIFALSTLFANMSANAANNPDSTKLLITPYTSLVSSSVTSVTALLSLAILFTIPTLANSVREQLKAKPFVDAGPGAVVGAFSGPMNLLVQLYHMYQSHKTTEYLSKQAGLSQKGEGSRG